MKTTMKSKPLPKVKKYETGGSADSDCWPGKPGCKAKKAARVNRRRKFWNSDTGKTIKKAGAAIGTAAAGTAAYMKNAFGVKDKVKEALGLQKGGSMKTVSKKQNGGTVKKKTVSTRKR
jgi:hypothetical protein